MPLLDLSNDLLLCVADHLDEQSSINAFAQTSRRLYSLLNSYLYQRNAEEHRSSALIWAAGHRRETTLKRALASGADHTVKSYTRYWTALHCVIRSSDINIGLRMIEPLLKSGADVNAQTHKGVTPLHMAIDSTYLCPAYNSVVQLLLRYNADLTKTCIYEGGSGWTVLHIASYIGNTLMVQLFVENGADIEARDDRSKTPLHYAVIGIARHGEENIETVRWLLKNGASKYARDKDDMTPQDMAMQNPNPLVQKLFQEYPAIISINGEEE